MSAIFGNIIPREILTTTFEFLADDPTSLRNIRLVCRKFEDVVVPINFRTITLTKALVDAYVPSDDYNKEYIRGRKVLPPTEQTLFQLQIGLHAKHVVIDRRLPWKSLWIMLLDLDSLQSIRWSYWNKAEDEDDDERRRYSLFFGVEPGMQRRMSPQVDLHIDGLDVSSYAAVCIARMRINNLRSLRLKRSRHTKHLDIEAFVKANPKLEEIELIGDKLSHEMWFQRPQLINHDTMPPIRSLVLQSYHWTHSSEAAITLWNWSELTHLELRDVLIHRFLTTVPPIHLLQLKVLVLHEAAAKPKVENTDRICDLVQQIRSLERLDIQCKVRLCVTSILRHGPTLHTIALNDYDLPIHLESQRSILLIADLEIINQHCPRVMDLSLDVFFDPSSGPPNALHINDVVFSEMRNLRRLKLYNRRTEPQLPANINADCCERLHRAVRSWLHTLVTMKQGAYFEKIRLDMDIHAHSTPMGNVGTAHVKMRWIYLLGEELELPTLERVGA